MGGPSASSTRTSPCQRIVMFPSRWFFPERQTCAGTSTSTNSMPSSVAVTLLLIGGNRTCTMDVYTRNRGKSTPLHKRDLTVTAFIPAPHTAPINPLLRPRYWSHEGPTSDVRSPRPLCIGRCRARRSQMAGSSRQAERNLIHVQVAGGTLERDVDLERR